MIDLSDQIQQLRCEIHSCGFSRRERSAAQAQLDQLIGQNTERERALDSALQAMDNTELARAA
jgi:hypothetical protein